MTPTRLKVVQIVSLIAILAVSFAVFSPVAARGKNLKGSELQFHDAMRKLWEDHITWTRLYIVSAANNLPDKDSTTQRLLQNQTDIGNAIKPYYGDAAGNQLTALLTDHILIAAQLIDAAKNNDTAAFNDAKTRWYANADEIAAFLHNANPKQWPLDQMQMMMHSHLDLTLQEAATYLGGDYNGSVAAYEQVHLEILQMADMLSQGIIAQFPTAFGGHINAGMNNH